MPDRKPANATQGRRRSLPPYYRQFRFCPHCGGVYAARDFRRSEVAFICRACGFTFYQNSISSATAVVPHAADPYAVVLITRLTPPGRGRRALPGGMLRYHEHPAQAAVRETREETQLDISIETFLCAVLVEYDFRGALVSVLEHAFVARPVDRSLAGRRTPEASAVRFNDVRRVLEAPQRLAFPEQALVLSAYVDRVRRAAARPLAICRI